MHIYIVSVEFTQVLIRVLSLDQMDPYSSAVLIRGPYSSTYGARQPSYPRSLDLGHRAGRYRHAQGPCLLSHILVFASFSPVSFYTRYGARSISFDLARTAKRDRASF
jgi:hypothetical protein